MAPSVPFTREFEVAYRTLRPKSDEYYKARFDLRQCGIHAMLHYSCRFNGKHKVAILSAAEKSPWQMAAVIEQVFECDALKLRLSRVDCTADVPGISVQWFWTHMRVLRKRRIKTINVCEECCNETGCTCYYGHGADLIRVYDKLAERRSKSREDPGSEQGALTRVERQLKSGRTPREFATLRDLTGNAAAFNPFASVVLLRGGKPEPNINDYPSGRYLQGLGLRQLILERGLAKAWNALSVSSRGNAGRKLSQLRDFLPADPKDFQIPDLFELYLRSLHRQFFGLEPEIEAHVANHSEFRDYSGVSDRPGEDPQSVLPGRCITNQKSAVPTALGEEAAAMDKELREQWGRWKAQTSVLGGFFKKIMEQKLHRYIRKSGSTKGYQRFEEYVSDVTGGIFQSTVLVDDFIAVGNQEDE